MLDAKAEDCPPQRGSRQNSGETSPLALTDIRAMYLYHPSPNICLPNIQTTDHQHSPRMHYLSLPVPYGRIVTRHFFDIVPTSHGPLCQFADMFRLGRWQCDGLCTPYDRQLQSRRDSGTILRSVSPNSNGPSRTNKRL